MSTLVNATPASGPMGPSGLLLTWAIPAGVYTQATMIGRPPPYFHFDAPRSGTSAWDMTSLQQVMPAAALADVNAAAAGNLTWTITGQSSYGGLTLILETGAVSKLPAQSSKYFAITSIDGHEGTWEIIAAGNSPDDVMLTAETVLAAAALATTVLNYTAAQTLLKKKLAHLKVLPRAYALAYVGNAGLLKFWPTNQVGNTGPLR